MNGRAGTGTAGLTRIAELLPEVLPAGLFDEVIRPEDVGYTHPVFLQCFMPQRHSPKNQEIWQTDCGRASLLMRAGVLVNPQRPNSFKKCVVPAGPKARLGRIQTWMNMNALKQLVNCVA